MPEGHSVHRFANRFAKDFVGQVVSVSSPQGRFSTDAALVSQRLLKRSYAIGKQMFLEFDGGGVLRIHLGIYGKWQFHASSNPPVTGQVRARFSVADLTADLRGPTVCELISRKEARAVAARLGPDPLNPNLNGRESKKFIDRVLGSKSAIGVLLMNQEVISGIGNVYRAEILFRAGVSPHRLGSQLSETEIQAIWNDSVKLLRVGVRTGFMITRDELFAKRPSKDARNFVYKREGQPCRVCEAPITIELMATRKLYWCAGCQV